MIGAEVPTIRGRAPEVGVSPEQGPNRVAKEIPLGVRPAFKREFLDFERGIRMGGLEPNERITQIVKAHLVARHGQPFIIDKWGRGRFWRWICWLPRARMPGRSSAMMSRT